MNAAKEVILLSIIFVSLVLLQWLSLSLGEADILIFETVKFQMWEHLNTQQCKHIIIIPHLQQFEVGVIFKRVCHFLLWIAEKNSARNFSGQQWELFGEINESICKSRTKIHQKKKKKRKKRMYYQMYYLSNSISGSWWKAYVEYRKWKI